MPPNCRLFVLVLPAVFVLSAACTKSANMLPLTDVQTRKIEQVRDRPRPYLTSMVDNALLHDMSVTDMHFIPHTSELSGTGAARLDRMAVMLNTYGGVVRYDTLMNDSELAQKRIDHVREYLEVAGCDVSRVQVTAMLSGGRGLTAKRAIEIDDAGTVEAVEGGPSSVAVLPGSGS